MLILGVVVLLFGHKRLPELGQALGQGLSSFKKGLEGKSEKEKDEPKFLKGSDRKRKSVTHWASKLFAISSNSPPIIS